MPDEPTNQPELEVVPPAQGPPIETLARADGPAIWQEYRTQLAPLLETAGTLQITDAGELPKLKLAHDTRLSLRSIRLEIERRRKELGEEALRRKQAIDRAAGELKAAIEPLELRMLELENFAEIQEQKRIDELRQARDAELVAVGANPAHFDSGRMQGEQFADLLTGLRAAKEQRERAAREAEEKRLEDERKRAEEAAAAAAEAERQRVENERLKKEAEEKEAALRAEREARERERAQAEEKRLAAERAAAERERQAAEQARREREAAEQAAAAERRRLADEAEQKRKAAEEKHRKEKADAEARAKAERERREKAEAELMERQAEEARKKREEEEARAAAAKAPDRDKLTHFAAQVRAIVVPELTTKEGKGTAKLIAAKVEEFGAWIEKKALEM